MNKLNSKIFFFKRFSPLYKILVFLPLLIYLGTRSPVAHDEGFYIIQAKNILETGDWITPYWLGNISLDRTIFIQVLIAFSQKIFGRNDFAIYLPITLGSILMIFLTYKLHQELVGKKLSLISPLILSTTFLWINYSHLATQDLLFGSFVTLGIYSSIKSKKSNKSFYFLLSGFWIGIAFFFKTYLTLIPLLALLPFLIYSRIIFNHYFWYGAICGFLPFCTWAILIIKEYGYQSFSGLYEKLLFLSNKNPSSNPFYYYLWNIPINLFPWSFFSIIGLIRSYEIKPKLNKYFLFYYPIFIIILLSFFSTKTPYYPIQILSLISINSYLGIIYIFNIKNKLVKLTKYLTFLGLPLILILGVFYINSYFSEINFGEYNKSTIIFSLLSFSLSWILVFFSKNLKSKLIFLILGPYLLFAINVQNGVLTDRSKDFRIATEDFLQNKIPNKEKIQVIRNEIDDEYSQKTLIKIDALTENEIITVEKFADINSNQYFWTKNKSKYILPKDKYLVISESDFFKPWVLFLKK